MKITKDQRGEVDIYAILLGFAVLLLVGVSAFGIWAFSERQDYKNNADAKAAEAAALAVEDREVELKAEFAEAQKSPYTSYTSPAAFGAVKVVYPKTWSAYIEEPQANNIPIDGYFSPGYVPTKGSKPSELRIQVVEQDMAQILKQFDGNVKRGDTRVSSYRPAKLPDVLGYRLDGKVVQEKTGAMILLPLRDKTIKIWTENMDFVDDLENIVLPELSFNP